MYRSKCKRVLWALLSYLQGVFGSLLLLPIIPRPHSGIWWSTLYFASHERWSIGLYLFPLCILELGFWLKIRRNLLIFFKAALFLCCVVDFLCTCGALARVLKLFWAPTLVSLKVLTVTNFSGWSREVTNRLCKPGLLHWCWKAFKTCKVLITWNIVIVSGLDEFS